MSHPAVLAELVGVALASSPSGEGLLEGRDKMFLKHPRRLPQRQGVQPQTVSAATSALISETGDYSFSELLNSGKKAPPLEQAARAIIRRAQAYFDTNKRKSGTQKNTSNKKRKADPSNCKRGGSSSWSFWK